MERKIVRTYIVRFSAFGQIKIVKVKAESMQDACLKAQPIIGYTLSVKPELPLFDSGNPYLACEISRLFGEGK